MGLSRERTRAYSCSALTGAFSAVALLVHREGRGGLAVVTAALSLCCGALAVAFEERAQARGT